MKIILIISILCVSIGTVLAADLKVGDKCATSSGTAGTVGIKYSEKGEAVGLTCIGSAAKTISRTPILSTGRKARSQDNENVNSAIFDRWGKMKTKASCETGGGVWAGENGGSLCTDPQKTQSQK